MTVIAVIEVTKNNSIKVPFMLYLTQNESEKKPKSKKNSCV